MNKAEQLNEFYHETLKKWLKGKCSAQAEAVSNSFNDEIIQASFDIQRDLFIVGSKEYSRTQVAHVLDNEEAFNLLIINMLQEYQ
jgi:hypothetical protein